MTQSTWPIIEAGTQEHGEEGYFVVYLDRIFAHSQLVLDKAEVLALAEWLSDVTGGGNDQSEELTEFVT